MLLNSNLSSYIHLYIYNLVFDGSTERRLTLAEVEPSNGFGGRLTDVGRHFRLFVLHAMPEVTTFWEDAPSGLLRVCDTKQSRADRLLQQVETPVHCHREKQQGFTSLHSAVSHSVNEVGKLVFKR